MVFWPRSQKVRDANKIAKAAILFARWAHEELGATVVMENPDQSYLWLVGKPYFGSPKAYTDVRMSYCMFGTSYKKAHALQSVGQRRLQPSWTTVRQKEWEESLRTACARAS